MIDAQIIQMTGLTSPENADDAITRGHIPCKWPFTDNLRIERRGTTGIRNCPHVYQTSHPKFWITNQFQFRNLTFTCSPSKNYLHKIVGVGA